MNDKRPLKGSAGAPGEPPRQPLAEADAQLEQDTANLRRAWAGLEAPEPPQLADQAVLNAARRAVARSARTGSRLRWLGGLATAAVVVLTLAIVMQQNGHAPPSERQFQGDGAPAKSELPAPATEPETRSLPATREMSKVAAEAEVMAAPQTAAAEAANDTAERDDSSLSDEALPSAEEWVQRLRTLRESGPPEAFRSELEAFRAAYPDYPLPQEWLE